MNGTKAKVRDYFDSTAAIYDHKHGVALAGQRHNFTRYYEPFLEEAVSAKASVLELGCGTGVYTRWLLDRGCTVVGMDLSSKILEQARLRCPEATFVVGDCEDPAKHLPETLRTQSFDVILGVNTFSYYPNKAEALAKYRHLLKSGGKAVFIEMNGRCPYWRMMTWINKNEVRTWYGEFKRLDSTTVKAMMEHAGFKTRRIDNFAFIPNGIGRAAVELLRPVDAVLHYLPVVRNMAMRVAVVAEKP